MSNKSRNEQGFALTYLDRFDIASRADGLLEPSGLALSHRKQALWTISDDTKKIFKLSLNGKLKSDQSFRIPHDGLEGIDLDPTGRFLFTVDEDNNQVIKVEIGTRNVVDRRRLADMDGYDAVGRYFDGGPANKGLEGIAWNDKTGTIVVMKEGNPGLLMELSSDLRAIRKHRLLNDENGFLDADVGTDELDFSDLCYDHYRDCYWIISDKARRLFLYDWTNDEVIHSARLAYGKDGEYREIEKAEGVAFDVEENRLYVVSDDEARLYVFDLR